MVRAIRRHSWAGGLVAMALFLTLAVAAAQQQGQTGQNQKDQAQPNQQDIPDAPSATRPPQPFPTSPSSERPAGTPDEAAPPDQTPPAGQAPPSSTNSTPQEGAPAQPPPFKITTVPAGGTSPDQSTSGEELYKIVSNVNQVIVPVRVTDDSGRLVNGLLPKDFSIFEDGKKQNLNFFTSDPFALSVAVVIDLGMPDVAIQKVNQTFPALEGAFSQFDEVSVYTYSNAVGRMMDFSAAGKRLTASLNELKTVRGANNGPPVTAGPLGPQGPTINGIPVDPSAPHVVTPAKESRVLNDAVLAAALDLNKRDKTRRKVIFIISDGREYRSNASYSDVLKVLLSNGIAVYGVAIEGSAMPGYGKLQRLHLPKTGYSNILPKYASATAGEISTELSRTAIENTYAHVIGDARNQYTLGYTTRATPSSTYRQIEVRVNRPACDTSFRPCVSVYARDGYYPLPVSR